MNASRRRRWAAWLGTVALCALMIPRAEGQEGSSFRREERFSGRVSEQRLKTTVRDLVRLGNRLGGSPSGDSASAYVDRAFRSLGLTTRMLVGTPRTVPVVGAWTLRVLEPKRVRGPIHDAWPILFSDSVPPETLTVWAGSSEEVPAGTGAVLSRGLPGGSRLAELSKANVRLILVDDSVNSKAYEDASLIHSFDQDRNHRIAGFSIPRSAARGLRDALDKRERVTVSASIRSSNMRGRSRTVEAILPGLTDTTFIVCAHGDADSGGPGADDNASGVAGVLELARVLQEECRAGRLSSPRWTLRFVVWGSEIESTGDYVRQWGDSLGRIAGVVNFDEIGTGASRDCLYFEGNDVEANRSVLKVCQEIAERYAGRKGFWTEAVTNPSQGGTDSYVFQPDALRRLSLKPVAIPSITVFTAAWNEPRTLLQTEGWRTTAWKGHPDTVVVDYSAYYHSSRDVPSTTTDREPRNMAWAVRAAGILLLRLVWRPS